MTARTVTAPSNRLGRALQRLHRVPGFARGWVRNMVLRRTVPFTGTAGLDYVQLSPQRVEVAVANRRCVQNHIHGVHAVAMTLVAETATGMVVGLNVRDDCIPLAKGLKVAFKRRAQGGLRAVATLTEEQRALMQQTSKGEVSVAVQVSDESGAQPIECEFIWAWIPAAPRQAQTPTH